MKVFNFSLDENSKIKLYRQLYNKIVEFINSNQLTIGKKLPSVRVLSKQLNISRNTVTKAYKELEETGFLYSLEKSGYYVKRPDYPATNTKLYTTETESDNEESVPTVDAIFKEHSPNHFQKFEQIHSEESYSDTNQSHLHPLSAPVDFSTVILNSGEVLSSDNSKVDSPDEALSKCYTQSFTNKLQILHKESVSDPMGEESFRVTLASFLYNFRGIDVNPTQIIVSSSFEQLIFNILSLSSLKNPRVNTEGMGLLKIAEQIEVSSKISPRLAVIEGFDSKISNIIKKAEYEVTEIPYDENGMNFDYMTTSGATIAFTSASDISEDSVLSTFDTNSGKKFLEWANNLNYRYIIEYDNSSNPNKDISFKCKDTNDKVIYLNSLSNLIANYVNGCFAILPKSLINEYKENYKDFGCSLSTLDQVSLTEFILSGKLMNYLSNMEEI